jgi:ectoine hydroxylase-related dioxygenase (phytanoyl-CoA dioxygenase family)
MTKIDVRLVVKKLHEDGYAVVENVVDPRVCEEMAAALDTMAAEQKARGERTAAVGDHIVVYSPYLHRPDLFLPWVDFEPFVDVANELLQNDHVILNGCAGSCSAGPQHGQAHRDGCLNVSDIACTTDILAAITLDDFSEKTGGTHVWPGSHLSGVNPKAVPNILERPERLVISAPKGSALFFLGQTWHMLGGNPSGKRRWGFFLQYSRWFVKPMFSHHTMGPELYSKLSVMHKQLFGFSSRPPDRPGGRSLTVMDPAKLPDSYDEVLAI